MTDARQRLHVIFRKDGAARYLSHLDLMATLEFSIRRARLPVALSEGFNPRPRMSLLAPLALGYIGEREVLEVTLRERIDPEAAREQLAATVPPGLTIRAVEEVPVDARAAASRIRSATYRVTLPAAVPDLAGRIDALLARDEIVVDEEREGRRVTRDIRPLLLAGEAVDDASLRLRVAIGGEGTIRPETVLDLLTIPREGATIAREKLDMA